jgi:hypothetical protein
MVVAGIPHIQFAVNFFMNVILICYCYNFATFSEELLAVFIV